MLTADAVLQREHQVSHELKDTDQLAVFDAQASELVVLNGIGGAVWAMLDGQMSLGDIAQEVAEHVPNAPSREEVEVEVIRFAQSLLERQAVSVVTPAA